MEHISLFREVRPTFLKFDKNRQNRGLWQLESQSTINEKDVFNKNRQEDPKMEYLPVYRGIGFEFHWECV